MLKQVVLETLDGRQNNMKTIYLNEILINIGDWDYKITLDGEGKEIIGNPLPEGVIEKDEEVVTNEDGSKSVVK
jgi:hypothetical protein